jgi:hypothetical protein
MYLARLNELACALNSTGNVAAANANSQVTQMLLDFIAISFQGVFVARPVCWF